MPAALEAGERVGAPCRGRWDSLRLFSPARYSGLPGAGFPAPAFHYPTKDETAPLGRVRPRDHAAAGIERVPRTVGVRDGRPCWRTGGSWRWRSTGARPS